MSQKHIIGRAEHIDLSLHGAERIPAKIDTGAFRSSIHASDIYVTKKGGKELLSFNLLGHPTHTLSYPKEVKRFKKVRVVNSFGHEEYRFAIPLKIRIGEHEFSSSFTLADRSSNIFPILIGRKSLKKRFIVDPDQTAVDRNEMKELIGADDTEDEEDFE